MTDRFIRPPGVVGEYTRIVQGRKAGRQEGRNSRQEGGKAEMTKAEGRKSGRQEELKDGRVTPLILSSLLSAFRPSTFVIPPFLPSSLEFLPFCPSAFL